MSNLDDARAHSRTLNRAANDVDSINNIMGSGAHYNLRSSKNKCLNQSNEDKYCAVFDSLYNNVKKDLSNNLKGNLYDHVYDAFNYLVNDLGNKRYDALDSFKQTLYNCEKNYSATEKVNTKAGKKLS